MSEYSKSLEDRLRGRHYWSDFENWVQDNDRQLYTAEEVKQVVCSQLWHQAFLSYSWAIAEKQYRKTHRASSFDADALRDVKGDATTRYFEEASIFADKCEVANEGRSLIELRDHLRLKLFPRASHDSGDPDFGGLTEVRRIKGKALEKAVAEEERRFGRRLTKAERAAVSRWPVTAFVAADKEGLGGDGEGGNAHDWLDILKEADAAWTDGHVSALENMVSQEENDAFRQLMLDVVRSQAKIVRRSNHGAVVWEAVIRYVALRAKDENYGQLGALCAEFGVDKSDVEDVLYNLSRNLVSAIVRRRPDLTHLLGNKSRSKALRDIARRNARKDN